MLLSYTACLYFPWWSIAIVAYIVTAIIPQNALMSFISGFIALFILWGAVSLWISSKNGHILAHKVSVIILKADNPYLLMLVSALIGALVAGFAALAGSHLRKLFHKPARTSSEVI
jgi:hypothetical protein